MKTIKKEGSPRGGLEGVWGKNGEKGRTPVQVVLKGFGLKTVKKIGPPMGGLEGV